MIVNAGIPSKAGGLDDRLEDWHRVVDVDFSGAYYCARVAGEVFRQQKSGNLIFRRQCRDTPSTSRSNKLIPSLSSLRL